MWCESCRQDVPAVANAEEGTVCCARCKHPMPMASGGAHFVGISDNGIDLSPPADSPAANPAGKMPDPTLDDWELDEEIRRADSLLRAHSGDRATGGPRRFRYDPPRLEVQFDAPDTESRSEGTDRPTNRRGSGLGWFTLCLGMMAFVCGAVLLGWSLLAGRSDLWNLGLPITLSGQCAMILGLIFQMERVAQTGSEASAVLQSVDDRLAGMSAARSGSRPTMSGETSYAARIDAAHFRQEQDELQSRLDRLAARLHG